MTHSYDENEIEPLGVELSNIRSFRTDSELSSGTNDEVDEEAILQWAAIDRLPTMDRVRHSLFNVHDGDESGSKGRKVVDVTKLGAPEKHMLIEKLIQHVEKDNLRLLHKMRKRMDRVGLKQPAIEVRCTNLQIEAECEVVDGKPLPTLWNSFKSMLSDITRLPGLPSSKAQISIIRDISCLIKPGRMTLLLGPPGCGKTTLLKALSGNLDKSLKVSGDISYNGYKFDEFVPQKTSAYISQYDLHTPEMTVRETLDFSACCQDIGSRTELMTELTRREKEAKIVPDPDIDGYMKAISVEGLKTSLQTDYILKILGLDICADTLSGDAMRRGISGGQKKRLTTGEMIVGPTRALFMDEISNGLDSSTTYQIMCFLQQLSHIMDATVLVALLQPAPETFELFDDIILMGDGNIVYHGARSDVLEFFRSCGFSCPVRKGVADFLQEVMSRKDQEQYWHNTQQSYSYMSVDNFSKEFKKSLYWKELNEELSVPFDKYKKGQKNALSFSTYSLPKWTLFRASMSRELLLLKRNSFVPISKFIQIVIVASITMTVFLRTQMGVDIVHANSYLGALYFSMIVFLFHGKPELFTTLARLPVFYKQRDLNFYPAWAFAIPAAIIRIPLSLLVAVVWTSLTYYVVGYAPEADRFFRQIILMFALHLVFVSMYRFIASVFRSRIASSAAFSAVTIFLLLFSGFNIPKPSMPTWLRWGFWISPLSYGMIGLSGNEFYAPRWQKELSGNTTVGRQTLENRGFNFREHLFWVSVLALLGFTVLFNIGFTLALSFLKAPGSRIIISSEKLSRLQRSKEPEDNEHARISRLVTNSIPHNDRVVLPFEPLTIAFQDVHYYVETPVAMKEHGFTHKRLKLLSDITGSFRPGVLTALMGVSGSGKTTLLDVLAGRKTSGIVEGEVRIGGYPKVQSTFVRISGYCEQTDIHSPHVTVEESVIFSAWLRLDPLIDPKTKHEFVHEVLETIELDEIKDELVGLPGVDGLSNEQRKRLTMAVELVANPSIIFMDEPTTGLDARAAAIVMRAVKNVANTGRTIVCTIHQPSIDIFEAFDELVLLKPGGRMIYYGPLGQKSANVIEYFESFSGVPKIKDNYNPATWMLDVTSTSSESELGVDFAQMYEHSALHVQNKELVRNLSTPPSGSKDLHFSTRYSQNGWGQFKACLWKQHWSYWRSPSYNLLRLLYMLFGAFGFGFLFRGQGKEIHTQQSLITLLGSIYISTFFCGTNNTSLVIPYVSKERAVFYREMFAGMYTSWAYSAAQVTIELPYVFVQSLIFTGIIYPMIGYYWSAYKVIWYLYTMFCTQLYFTYLGMFIMSISRNLPVAATAQSSFFNIFNLLAGFVIPCPQIPKWWIWLYYLVPTSWSLNGMLTSQFGDIEKEISVFGETKTVAAFLRDYFGYEQKMLPLVGVMLMLYPIVFASLFAYFIGKLNFQKR